MASLTNTTMSTETGTTKAVKALFVKAQNMIVFMPCTATTPAHKATPATVLLLTGPTSMRTEARTLNPDQLGETVYLETIDEGTVQFIISAMPRILEDMHR
jgi:hypothetical protein